MKKQIWLLLLMGILHCSITDATLPFATESELSVFLKLKQVKKGIVKEPQGFLHFQYIVPAGPYYQLFDWDMYFMSLALSYDKVSEPTIGSIKNFLEYVDTNANAPGYVPREIGPEGFWALPEQAKPFLAQATLKVSQTTGDFSWIGDGYRKLQLTLQFWEENRKASDGLFIWHNGTESGSDNNPAVISTPSMVTEGVDLQVYIYREYLALSKIATKLGKTQDAANYLASAESLRKKMIALMWDNHDGLFYNINARSGHKIKIRTWTNFTPLWGKMLKLTNRAEKSMAVRMIEMHLLNPSEFWAKFGVRTLSATESLYSPQQGYWQGPVWVISNWMMMHSLLNYGYKTKATELSQATTDLLVMDFKNSGGMNECYNPETGDSTAGGNFISWNLLAEHMQDEAKSGYDPADF